MIGSLPGFASSVVNFCQLPTLCVAMSIRSMAHIFTSGANMRMWCKWVDSDRHIRRPVEGRNVGQTGAGTELASDGALGHWFRDFKHTTS